MAHEIALSAAPCSPRFHAAIAAWVVLVSALFAGCEKRHTADDSQVAARVNEGEISVHQVQAVLQKQPKLTAGADGAAAQVLEVLIDQELAAQAASRQGLESDPGVIQQLQLARREVLARAFHDRVAFKAVPPASDEIDRYFQDHPYLFAERKLYGLQEFAVEGATPQIARLQEQGKQMKSADAVANLLRDLGLQYTTRQFVQASEDVPLGLLKLLAPLGIGQSVVVEQAGGARIFSVIQLQPAPVDRRTASPGIARYLMAERQRKLVGDAMTELRNGSNVRYSGAFAKPAAAASAAQPALATTR